MPYPAHEPYHERSVDAQILDALLRIEELLRAQAEPVVIATADIAANGKPSITQTVPAKGRRK